MTVAILVLGVVMSVATMATVVVLLHSSAPPSPSLTALLVSARYLVTVLLLAFDWGRRG